MFASLFSADKYNRFYGTLWFCLCGRLFTSFWKESSFRLYGFLSQYPKSRQFLNSQDVLIFCAAVFQCSFVNGPTLFIGFNRALLVPLTDSATSVYNLSELLKMFWCIMNICAQFIASFWSNSNTKSFLCFNTYRNY